MHLYALRRSIAAGQGRACWRLQLRSDVETQIQHPHLRLKSLIAESRGVVRCFDTGFVQPFIGRRLFSISRPGRYSKLLSICLISVHPPDKGLCPRVEQICVYTVVRHLSSSYLLRPPSALCVSVFGGLILHSYVVLSDNSTVAVQVKGSSSRVI